MGQLLFKTLTKRTPDDKVALAHKNLSTAQGTSSNFHLQIG